LRFDGFLQLSFRDRGSVLGIDAVRVLPQSLFVGRTLAGS